MADINFGKHVLESLSIGMYSDPMTIYREYIQNATDAIDKAVSLEIIEKKEAKIHVIINKGKKIISIEDNGVGVKSEMVYNTLLDIANSKKDYRESRGFRGIGRLGGLGHSRKLYFITSHLGENLKSIVEWDGDKFLDMLNIDNTDVETALEVIEKATNVRQEIEEIDKHYFKVVLEGVYEQFDELLDEQKVDYYLATVAPVPFDGQKFIHSKTITEEFEKINRPIETYNIFLNNREKPIYKQYRTHFKTGHQEKNKKDDQIQEIRFFEDVKEDGFLLYKGWYAITNFYGLVDDEYMCGIRIRKGNILIGGENTFVKFFSSEGNVANRWFIGEVHVYDARILPNTKRDDFERNDAYEILRKSLTEKADMMNRVHRRAMSNFHSKVKNITNNLNKLVEISSQVENGMIDSEVKRDKLLEDKKEIEKKLEKERKELSKLVEKDKLDDKYINTAKNILVVAEQAKKTIVSVENNIINAESSTKNDLPTSYSREERKLYNRIIESIYEFFKQDIQTADALKKKILNDLKVKKKK